MSTPTRREVLVALVATGCLPSANPDDCSTASTGLPPAYCDVEGRVVRVAGAASLAPGQAVIANVDDFTAVIVARDEAGFHALSGICTHQCCVVSLCESASCRRWTPTPATCETTDAATADPAALSIHCPCHGSEFRVEDGGVLHGPALDPLPALQATIDAGDVLVDTGVVVDAAVRV